MSKSKSDSEIDLLGQVRPTSGTVGRPGSRRLMRLGLPLAGIDPSGDGDGSPPPDDGGNVPRPPGPDVPPGPPEFTALPTMGHEGEVGGPETVVARSPDRATGPDRRSPDFEAETCGRRPWSGQETRPQQGETRP
jgi:hypothetical protein